MTAPAAAIETLSGGAIRAVVPELARLRVEVFRDWPYLYDGDLAYERRYLAKYAGMEDATIVVARVDGRVVGASTALPLATAEKEMQRPFLDAGLDPRDWYYFGESVLEAAHRGRGIGVAFFRAREARAAALGFRRTTFCERPARGGSTTSTSGLPAFSTRSRSARRTSPAKNFAEPMSLRRAFSIASATASSTISTPQISPARCASERPTVPMPQNRS